MPEALQIAIGQLLKSLIKAMINGGITFPVLVDPLREAYVEITQADYGIDGKPPTNSRITLLTGVLRKEISRLRSETPGEQRPPEKISLSAKAIAVWCSKPEYLNEHGYSEHYREPRLLESHP